MPFQITAMSKKLRFLSVLNYVLRRSPIILLPGLLLLLAVLNPSQFGSELEIWQTETLWRYAACLAVLVVVPLASIISLQRSYLWERVCDTFVVTLPAAVWTYALYEKSG